MTEPVGSPLSLQATVRTHMDTRLRPVPDAMLETPPVAGADSDPALLQAAQAFEAAFIAEMLAYSGLGAPPKEFGGGSGEAQFAGLLREAQAEELAAAGGFGLAQYIVTAMERRPYAK